MCSSFVVSIIWQYRGCNNIISLYKYPGGNKNPGTLSGSPRYFAL